MTERQKQIVSETFPLIREMALPVTLLFYGRLFDLDPSLRQLFKIDLKEQSKKLIATLDALVESIDDWQRIVPVLHQLGQRHVGYGVKEQYYDTVCSALVWAFGQALNLASTTRCVLPGPPLSGPSTNR